MEEVPLEIFSNNMVYCQPNIQKKKRWMVRSYRELQLLKETIALKTTFRTLKKKKKIDWYVLCTTVLESVKRCKLYERPEIHFQNGLQSRIKFQQKTECQKSSERKKNKYII